MACCTRGRLGIVFVILYAVTAEEELTDSSCFLQTRTNLSSQQHQMGRKISLDPRRVHDAALHLGVDLGLLSLEYEQDVYPEWIKGDWLKNHEMEMSRNSKLASRDKAMISGLGPIFSSFGGMMGKWMTGQTVTATDYILLAQSGVLAGIDIAKTALGWWMDSLELIGGFAASFVGLIGSFLVGIIKMIFAWFLPTPPEPSTGELIKAALAKDRMAESKDFWRGFADELSWMGAMFSNQPFSDARTAWYLVLQHDLAVNKASVFHRDCLSNATWDSDNCKQWIEDGMWEIMVPYAQNHLAVMAELTSNIMINPSISIGIKQQQVDAIVHRMREVGREYVDALKHAWDLFYPYRMSLIWDQSEKDIEFAKDTGKLYHPFDFLHARVDQGYDALNLKVPVDKSMSVAKQIKQIRKPAEKTGDGFAYKGCEGERHASVTNRRRQTEPNHACNLYQHILTSPAEGGCGCHPGRDHTHGGGRWYDQWDNKHRRRAGLISNAQCWRACVSKYTEGQREALKNGFEENVKQMEDYVTNMTAYPPTLKVDLQPKNTQCEPQNIIKKDKCLEALNLTKLVTITSTTPLLEVNATNIPAGCSFKVIDASAIYNVASNAHGAPDYRPVCGAIFFDYNNTGVSSNQSQ